MLWRVKANLILKPEKFLPDRSYLASVYQSSADRKQKRNGIQVRVIEYKFGWIRGTGTYRLVTTIFDYDRAPAHELAALYHERWEIETALGEGKTKLKGPTVMMRSKTPDLVKQEFYGFMLTYFVIRKLMHEAAIQADDDPDRLSFKHTVQVIRLKIHLFRAFPQRRWPEIRQIIINEILEESVELRRYRRNHRGVKRKMSNYEIANRKLDRAWCDEPTKRIAIIRPKSRKVS